MNDKQAYRKIKMLEQMLENNKKKALSEIIKQRFYLVAGAGFEPTTFGL